jgi:hypothetical protein
MKIERGGGGRKDGKGRDGETHRKSKKERLGREEKQRDGYRQMER